MPKLPKPNEASNGGLPNIGLSKAGISKAGYIPNLNMYLYKVLALNILFI